MKKSLFILLISLIGFTTNNQLFAQDPVAVCQNITIQLDANGQATLNPSDLDGGSSGNNITLSASQTLFHCDDVGATSFIDKFVITGVFDGPLTGGTPKAIELYVLADIPDLSFYGIGSANNGGGSDGEEFTFPTVAVSAGTFLYVATEEVSFNTFFGFTPDYINRASAINGDDAIELFYDGSVIDVFGDINVDGTGQPWEYLDGWAYRNDDSVSDGSIFVIENWLFSGINVMDGESSNGTAAIPFPIGSYTPQGGESGTVVTLTVTDENSNTSTCTATVTVEDNIAPEALCQNVSLQLDEDGNASITPEEVDNGSNDVCSNVTLSLDIDTFDCSNIGSDNTVTLTVTDISGNTSTCTATVTVGANEDPIAICKDLTVELDESGQANITAADIDNGSYKICGNVTLSIDIDTFSCEDVSQGGVPVGDQVWINEFHYDNLGSDVGEFVEVVSNFNASAYQLVLYNGNNGLSYNTSGLTFATNVSGFTIYTASISGIQNGAPDGIALVDDGGTVVEFLSYEGSFMAEDGPANGMISIDVGVSESDPVPDIGQSLQLIGTGSQSSDFTWSEPITETPGALNEGQSLPTGDFVEVTLTVSDDEGSSVQCNAKVTVIDNIAPLLTVIANPINLWSPNHDYQAIDVSQLVVAVSDNCNANLTMDDVYISSVSSDEEENSNGGDGNTLDDIVINQDCQSVLLRKERKGNGNGRVYTIYLEVDDGNGNTGLANCKVYVPHDIFWKVIDDGMAYEETCNISSNISYRLSLNSVRGNNSSLRIYPNPSKSYFNLRLQSDNVTDNIEILVYDINGRQVYYSQGYANQEYRVSATLQTGLYFVNVIQGNESQVVKLIKE